MTFLSQDPEMLEFLGLPPAQVKSPAPFDVLPAGAGETFAIAGDAYEGASRTNNELAMWMPSMGSADTDSLYDKPMMDARVRDTMRNDAYVKSGSNIHKDNIVGATFTLNAKPNHLVLGLDEKWSEEFQAEVEAKFALWAESPRNYPDASRINSFTGLVRMAVGMELMAGEVLSVAEWLPGYGPFSTAIQMIDPDRLSDPTHILNNPRLRGGVLRNRNNAPLGYYIRNGHPAEHEMGKLESWKYVKAQTPWGRQQVIHIYEQWRPAQSRGVAGMVAALKEMRITRQFRDVTLQNAVVNSTFAASIESELPSEAVFASLGGGTGSQDFGSLVGNYAGGYLGALNEYTKNANVAKINGVRIPHFFPGTKLQLRPAGQGGPLGNDFEQSLLRYIAANLDVSYEQLSRDYSQTNYSSVRAALNETHKGMQSRKRATADRYANHIYALWLEEAIAAGEITTVSKRAPNFWDGLNREAYTSADWIGASRGQIDELKETQAAVLRLKYGLTTKEAELSRLGQDWRKVNAQLSREKADEKARGLVFGEDDNMINAVSGAPREKEAKDEKDDGSDDNTDV